MRARAAAFVVGVIGVRLVLGGCATGYRPRAIPPPTVTTIDLRPRLAGGHDPDAERAFTFTPGIETFTTASGLRVALVPDARTHVATIDVRYDVGAAADPPGLGGLAHLVEHALFVMTPMAGGPALGDTLRDVALTINGSTTWDETHFTTTADAGAVARVLELEAARMAATCAQLDDAALARERDVVLAEEAERASPAAALDRQLAGVIYGLQHPYAREIGSRQVAAATRADVCAFIARHYAPSRAYLVVTGAIDVGAMHAQVERAFAAPARADLAPPVAISAPVLDGRVTRTTAPVSRPTAVVVFAFPPWGAPERVPAAVGARILRRELARAVPEEAWLVDSEVAVLGGPRAPVLAAVLTVDDAAHLGEAADEILVLASRVRTYDDYDVVPALSSVVLEQLARWDDLPGRGAWLADYLQYTTHARFMLAELDAAREGWAAHRTAIADGLTAAHARVVLLDPGLAPAGRARVTDSGGAGTHDLMPWRAPVDVAEADRPLDPPTRAASTIERYTLASGLQVALAPDAGSPLVDARLVFPTPMTTRAPRRSSASAAACSGARTRTCRRRSGTRRRCARSTSPTCARGRHGTSARVARRWW